MTNHLLSKFHHHLIFVLLCCFITPQSFAINITFTEVSDDVGLTYVGQSFGASWGDIQRDDLPDLYLSNHLNAPSIFENDGTGFTDIGDQVVGLFSGDTHAGAWGDYDNDGDQDLAITKGAFFGMSSESNLVLEYTGTLFLDRATALGLQLGEGRGRTPLWFDWNNDGRLDIVFSNIPRDDGLAPTTLFSQSLAGFNSINGAVGFNPAGNNGYATLFRKSPTSSPRLLVQQNFPFPAGLYDYSVNPFVDDWNTTFLTPINGSTTDFISGDFDNDLKAEMHLSVWRDPMVVRTVTPTQIRAFLIGEAGLELGFSFETAGLSTLSVGPISSLSAADVKLGAAGVSPAELSFELDSSDAQFWGEFSGDPNMAGFFVHYDQALSQWVVRQKIVGAIGIVVNTVATVENLQTFGLPVLEDPKRHVFLDAPGDIYFDVTNTAGLAGDRSCSASAAADFDNDRDLDLYLLCHDKAGNLPNQLLENNGSGVFTLVAGAAGAEGTMAGVGDSIALADYDSDGNIDILVTNGAGAPPLSDDGPTQLFKNSGNSNRWLGINLHGTLSNSDGVGATVVISAGGVTQYRYQNGGMHNFAQHDSRIHFGLGLSNQVDTIEVRWPSGVVQNISNVPVNRYMDIVEPSDGDMDTDTIADAVDNCVEISNVEQRDTDGDGFGNFCDPDHNNDCVINFLDLQIMAADFLTTGANLDTDINGDQVVNFVDAFAVIDAFLAQPGPSALASCP